MPEPPALDRNYLLLLLWIIVLVELVSPVPAVLTLGAVWVLLTRPLWFRDIVRVLYDEPRT